MFVRKLNPEKFQKAYGGLYQQLYPWQDVVNPPFTSMWCVVEPGKVTQIHNHHEGETFFIVEGEGEITVENEAENVGTGDVIYFPPFVNHTLKNTSTTENLSFVSVFWEDMKSVAENAKAATNKTGTEAKKVLVIAALPTTNGDLHLGHLAGPFVSADLYTRYLKMRGTEAYLVSGTDDYQSYVPLKGENLELTASQILERFSKTILKTMQEVGMEIDFFLSPYQHSDYHQFVQELFLKLYREGKIIVKETPSLYCESCDRYIFQAYVQGQCPHCGAGSDGNGCEACGRPNDCIDLSDPICKTCQNKPIEKPLAKFYFSLSHYESELRDYYQNVQMSAHMGSICEGMLGDGLPEVVVSHPTDWGVSIPVEGFEGQCIEPYFDVTASFLFVAQKLKELKGKLTDIPDFWHAEDARIVQFCGIDNAYVVGVMMPALLLASDPTIKLASGFITNEFYRLEGLKFSTSRGHLIGGSEFLQQFSSDVVRFYVSYDRPEIEQTSFSQTEFEQTIERELIGEWTQWLRAVNTKVSNEYNGIVPEPGAWTNSHRIFYQELHQLTKAVTSAYELETFSPQKATRSLCELVRTARRFGLSEDYLKQLNGKENERRTAIALELAAVKALALLAAPIMPNFTTQLWQQLGYETPLFQGTWEETPHFIPGGQKIGNLPQINQFTQKTAIV
ncbi:MAG: class I tRNA ligase family protein [Microcoleaceae cyanobacterium]